MGIFSQEKEGFLREKFTEVSIPLEGTLSQQVFKKIVKLYSKLLLWFATNGFLYVSKLRSIFMFCLNFDLILFC